MMIPGYALDGGILLLHSKSLYRARRLSDGLPLATKTLDAEYPSRLQVAELRREYHIALRLQPVESVIRVYALEAYGNGNLALVLEPFGRSLVDQITAARPRTLPLARVLGIAFAVADTLGRV